MTTQSDDLNSVWTGPRCATCGKPIVPSISSKDRWSHAFAGDFSGEHNAGPNDDWQPANGAYGPEASK